MADHLKKLAPKALAAWYYRLAAASAKHKINGTTPLSSVFLKHWLDNRVKDSEFLFDAPGYLSNHKAVRKVQTFHRDVFLTKKQAALDSGDKWAGIIPRLQGKGYTLWKPTTSLTLDYHSHCDVAPGLSDIIKIQHSGMAAEKDIFASLRGFQVHSKIVVTGKVLKDGLVQITFVSWKSWVTDRYDWDNAKHLTVPNPDFGSKESDAVRPEDKTIEVHHSNARRLEAAGLAAPYLVKSRPWSVTDTSLLKPENVDPKKKI